MNIHIHNWSKWSKLKPFIFKREFWGMICSGLKEERYGLKQERHCLSCGKGQARFQHPRKYD